MSAMFPLAVWQPGTLQPSVPVNDNALRTEVLARGALSILSTPPGSPADGQVHILGASPTGAWSSFAQNDVVLWRSGTWYRFAPFTGWLKQVGTEVRRYSGTAWEIGAEPSGAAAAAVAAHVAAADPHPQYLTPAEASAAYAAASHTHTAAQISDSTATGRALITAADAAAGRTALGLGSAATSALSTTNAAALGTAAPGSETTVARADHVHPMPTAAQVGADPAGTGASQAAVAVNARIQAGTVTGRYARWNNTAARWEEFDLLGSGNTWTGTNTYTQNVTIGDGTTTRNLTVQGATSGANSGAFVGARLGSTGFVYPGVIGNRSAIIGGAHSPQGILWSVGTGLPFDVVCAEGLTVNGNTAWHAGNSAQVVAGTATGQVALWNNTTGRYEPVTLNTLPDAIDDAAAAGLGVAVGGLYRTGSTLKARIA